MFTFHHIALTVSNLEASKAFYTLLGFKSVLDWVCPDGDLMITHLQCDAVFIELFCLNKPKQLKQKNQHHDLSEIGLKHFSLRVDCIEKARDYMISANLITEEDVVITQGRTGITYFFINDPDGNAVEIVEDKREFA